MRDKLWNMEIGYITKTDGEKLIHYLATETIDRICAIITQQTTAARIDEIDWCRNEVENDIPINVYDKLSDRIAQLQKEVK